jgi:thioredoxin reductase
MHFEETLKYLEMFKDKIDILHVSAGLHGEFQYMKYWYQNWMMPRQFNVHWAEKIKKAFPDLLVCTVGSIMNLKDAEEIIATGKADFVAMCRPLLADPEMPRKFALGREDDHRPCLRCQYCGRRLLVPAVINCAVNPMLGEECDFPGGIVPKAPVKKRVGVVGGGPAGIVAMLTLLDRGHEVTLYEKTDTLGGNVIPAAAPSFKIDMQDYLKYLQHQGAKAAARVLLNTEATPELLEKENFDALIIAVGADPIIPKSLPGIDKPHVHWAADADMGKVTVGKKVVVVGAGAVGVECAIDLGKKGHEVTIVEMQPNLRALMQTSGGAMFELMDALKEHNTPIHTSHQLKEVTDAGVVCLNLETNEDVTFEADTVLLALGMRPRFEVADSLRRCAPETEVFVVGDAIEAKTIAEATKSDFKAAAFL